MKPQIKEKLYRQLALDYCCTADDIYDNRNHYTEYCKLDGRRRFDESDNCILKVITVNSKVIITGEKQIIEACRSAFGDCSGNWFMDVGNFRTLENIVSQHGYRLRTAHPFFVPTDDSVLSPEGFEIKKFSHDEIQQFRGMPEYDEAFCFDDNAPDMIGVAAVADGRIVGMAGASADSPYLWQIGINVDRNYEGRGIASSIVSIIKKDIMDMGILPYYGTSISNLPSQRVAAKAGFEVAWVELLSEKAK